MAHIRKHSKGHTYEYRRTVPSDLVNRLGKVEGFDNEPGQANLTKSLDTLHKAKANRLAALLNSNVEAAFKVARASAIQALHPSDNFSGRESELPAAVRKAVDAWLAAALKKARENAVQGLPLSNRTAYSLGKKNPDGLWSVEEFFLRPARLGMPFIHSLRGIIQRYCDHTRVDFEGDDKTGEQLFDEFLIEIGHRNNIALDTKHLLFPMFRGLLVKASNSFLTQAPEYEHDIASYDEANQHVEPTSSNGLQSSFDFKLNDWVLFQKNGKMEQRQIDMYSRTISSFSKFVGGNLGTVSGRTAQRWIEELSNQGFAPKTIKTRVAAVANYWRYLKKHEIVPLDGSPFADREYPGAKNKENPRSEWSQEEIVQLWRAATIGGDTVLADAIRIAAFTGMRIESIFAIRIEHVPPTNGIRVITILKDKTEAGVRDVPIHSSLMNQIDKHISLARTSDGYLLPSNAKNKYQNRSPPTSKRFGRLKSSMGFDGDKVFHSIRKTVTSFFQDSEVPEFVAADIIGHEKPTMTYGLYAKKVDIKLRKAAVEMIKFDDEDFMNGTLKTVPSETIT